VISFGGSLRAWVIRCRRTGPVAGAGALKVPNPAVDRGPISIPGWHGTTANELQAIHLAVSFRTYPNLNGAHPVAWADEPALPIQQLGEHAHDSLEMPV
jgi:hypothetical protein